MKKLLLSLVLLTGLGASAQDGRIYGTWVNSSGESVVIDVDHTFIRRASSEIKAYGELEFSEDGILKIHRNDTNESYLLEYYIGETTFVVETPHSGGKKSWLFFRAGY